jgi:D-alanine-D-alanine ligase
MALEIGLVYDLKEDYLSAGFSADEVMEFDSEETVAGLAAGLTGLGHRVERVGRGLELAQRLVGGKRWDLVFSIAEGVHGRSREAQVPALCELFGQPYVFADPLSSALTLDKAMAKRVIRDHGIPTARFAVVDAPADAASVDLELPVFAKPVAEGSSKGVTGRSLVRSSEELATACASLIEKFRQPVLVESYLTGREVTVGIVGNGPAARVVGVMEVLITGGDETHSYTAVNKKEWRERVRYRLLAAADPLAVSSAKLALACFSALGCRDGARIDVRCDGDGTPCFLEANPLPGLDPEWSDLPIIARLAGHTYGELLGWIVDSARERHGL